MKKYKQFLIRKGPFQTKSLDNHLPKSAHARK